MLYNLNYKTTINIETIGENNFNAKLFENGHLGCDTLEVIDFQYVMWVVKPEPVYNTEIHATFDPLPFNPDLPPVVTFGTANLPEYTRWGIMDEYDNNVIVPDTDSVIIPDTSYNTNSEIGYHQGTLLFLGLYDEQDLLIYRCEIIIDNE